MVVEGGDLAGQLKIARQVKPAGPIKKIADPKATETSKWPTTELPVSSKKKKKVVE